VKLYRIRNGQHGQILHWYGTQDEARKAGRETGFWEQVEVPVDKPGLLNWLNQHSIVEGIPVDGAQPDFVKDVNEDPDPIEAAEMRAVAAAQPAPVKPVDATAIEDFILNHASIAQVESIFARLGTRFKELQRASGQPL
jgi:hypothetical protein